MMTWRSVATSSGGEPQVGHPVGLHVHEGAELLLGDALVIGGHILAGEGVVLPAEPGDDLGELADRDLVGRLEHQVLEEVGDAGHALGLVGGADLVPDHVGDDGGPVVGDDDHLHAVGELELAGTRLGAGRERFVVRMRALRLPSKGLPSKGSESGGGRASASIKPRFRLARGVPATSCIPSRSPPSQKTGIVIEGGATGPYPRAPTSRGSTLPCQMTTCSSVAGRHRLRHRCHFRRTRGA